MKPFKEGRVSTNDEAHSGIPPNAINKNTIATITAVRAIIAQDVCVQHYIDFIMNTVSRLQRVCCTQYIRMTLD